MRRLSVRRSHSAEDLWFAALGLGLGFVSAFLVRGVLGQVDRRRLQHFVTGLTGEHPSAPTPREAAGRIEAALADDPILAAVDFDVVPVRPGRVELHGWVATRRAGARALRLAAEAAPETEVTNRLRVRGEDDLPEPPAGKPTAARQPA
jgi:hypothetical protein